MNIISQQPAEDSINAAYRPIVYRFQVDTTTQDCKLAYCDIYINGNYYRSLHKTEPIASTVSTKTFEFDIQNPCQTYLKQYLAPNGTILFKEAAPLVCFVLCKFRSTYTDANGFVASTFIAPVQATDHTSPVAGNGLPSDLSYVINATLQHEDRQDLQGHLNTFKTGAWSADVQPLSHRPPKTHIGPNSSDSFPIVNNTGYIPDCIKLNWKSRLTGTWSQVNNCVCIPVDFSMFGLPNAIIGEPYSFAKIFIGTGPFTLEDVVKPAWMAITIVDHKLVFDGTPTVLHDNAEVSFKIVGQCGNKLFYGMVDVIDGCEPIAISAATLPDAEVGVAYNYEVGLTGTLPYDIAFITIPAWMSYNLVGGVIQLTGMPDFSDIGVQNIFIQVINGCGDDTLDQDIDVQGPGGKLYLDTAHYTGDYGTVTGICHFDMSFTRSNAARDQAVYDNKRVQATFHVTADTGCAGDVVVVFEPGDLTVYEGGDFSCMGPCGGASSVNPTSLIVIP